MTKKRHSRQAVSEVVGVILLLGITIGLFCFLNYIVFSFSFQPSAPSVNLIGSISTYETDKYITIEHNGGEPLDGNTQIIITIDSTSYQSSVSEIPKLYWKFSNNNKNPDKWDFGETILYGPVTITVNNNIRAIVMDTSTNTLILSVVLQ